MILKKTVIIIFAYNRPSHLKRVLIALENNKVKNDASKKKNYTRNKI